MSAPAALPSLSYAEVRSRWCRAALLALLRRWGIYLAAGVLILGGFSNGALSSMSALAAWSVLPLLHAAASSPWLAALVAVAHGLVGAVVLWGLRPLLWPRHWAEVERALPLRAAERRRSDLTVLLFGLAPLWAVYAAGTARWLLDLPAWLPPVLARAAAMLALSMALSVAAGLAMLHRMRRPPPALRRRPHRATYATAIMRGTTPLQALTLRPLWRGPAQRLARLWLLGAAALFGVAAALWRWGEAAPWWLAAFAALSLLLTSRLRSLAETDLAPLHDAAAPLPLRREVLRWSRHGVVLSPLPPALAAIVIALLHGPRDVRPAVLAAYGVTCVAASVVQVVWPGRVAESQVSRWLLSLVLMLALASEAVR
ncbi:MAG TPA: hypothetical protein VKI18_14980 [Albitalea sp.]|nr:hypothetical protein [Albitalea sp.]